MNEIPVDAVTEPWWAATRERRLLLQRCDCAPEARWFPPRALCPGCGGDTLGWEPASGAARVDAWTMVHRGADPGGGDGPYVVARVRLAEGPVLLTNLTGRPAGGWRCGAPVRLAWRPVGDGRHLPVFAPETGTE